MLSIENDHLSRQTQDKQKEIAGNKKWLLSQSLLRFQEQKFEALSEKLDRMTQ